MENPLHAPFGEQLRLDRSAAGVLEIAVGGDWTLSRGLAGLESVDAALQAAETPARVRLDVSGVESWDSSLVVLVERIVALCADRGIALDRVGVPRGLGNLVDLARAVPERAGTRKPGARVGFVAAVGRAALGHLRAGGEQVAFLGEVGIATWRLLRGRAVFQWPDVLQFMRACGPQAIGIVSVINLLIGMILAFIGAVQLQKFGAGIYVADLVGLAVTREMAAVMTGIVLAGRTGAAFAAQLGTMQAQEEIDALSTFGIPPVEFLVLPRMLALIVMMPLLYAYASAVGLTGGFIVGVGMLDLTPAAYIGETRWAVTFSQFLIGLVKSAVFGVLVAVAGCLRGMQAGRSASGVGDAATSAVVTAILYIIVTDALFAIILNMIGI